MTPCSSAYYPAPRGLQASFPQHIESTPRHNRVVPAEAVGRAPHISMLRSQTQSTSHSYIVAADPTAACYTDWHLCQSARQDVQLICLSSELMDYNHTSPCTISARYFTCIASIHYVSMILNDAYSRILRTLCACSQSPMERHVQQCKQKHIQKEICILRSLHEYTKHASS